METSLSIYTMQLIMSYSFFILKTFYIYSFHYISTLCYFILSTFIPSFQLLTSEITAVSINYFYWFEFIIKKKKLWKHKSNKKIKILCLQKVIYLILDNFFVLLLSAEREQKQKYKFTKMDFMIKHLNNVWSLILILNSGSKLKENSFSSRKEIPNLPTSYPHKKISEYGENVWSFD